MLESIVTLLIVAIVLMGVLLLISVVVLRRLRRIEQAVSVLQNTQHQVVKSSGSDVDDLSAGGAFEEFLSEDPQRLALAKSEQFAEFRKWRKDKGMNWSGS